MEADLALRIRSWPGQVQVRRTHNGSPRSDAHRRTHTQAAITLLSVYSRRVPPMPSCKTLRYRLGRRYMSEYGSSALTPSKVYYAIEIRSWLQLVSERPCGSFVGVSALDSALTYSRNMLPASKYFIIFGVYLVPHSSFIRIDALL